MGGGDIYLEPAWENGRPVHPHITMTMIHGFEGNDDIILWGELVPLISAMRSRANQPLVTEQQEMEKLFDENREIFPELRRTFSGESAFPVLMLSFLNNQHGRVFYARMQGRRMVIHQSKLYSFHTLSEAPLELFAQFLLSSPSVV